MMSIASKHRWLGLSVMFFLLFTSLGPIENGKILGAHIEQADSEKPVLHEVDRVTDLHGITPEDSVEGFGTIPGIGVNTAIIDRLSGVVSSEKQWFELAKIAPVFHIDNIKKYSTVEVTATGYYAGIESTGKTSSHPDYGITYSGVKVRRDLFSTIAADRRVFPIGTILHIPGYGYGVVADTGSAIKGKKIDLYFQTKKQVFSEWGKKKVKVRVIHRGDGKLKESDLDMLNNLILENNLRKVSV